MTASKPERADYYVYAYRIGGVMAYVGKGCGQRVTKHLTASHNPYLNAWIAHARTNNLLVQVRVLKHRLIEKDARRLEGRCFEKWQRTLCNRNHPYPWLDWERDEAEWEAFKASDEYESSICGQTDRWLEAVNAFYDGKLSHEEAVEWGFVGEEGSPA
jgi:hypothetical protein